jgi:hypothetical protein
MRKSFGIMKDVVGQQTGMETHRKYKQQTVPSPSSNRGRRCMM